MPISLVRIDDRLVHGQVVQGWLKAISVDILLVASDIAAEDKMQKLLMEMAVPSDIKLEVKSLQDAVAVLKVVNCKYNIMVLVASPKEAFYILEQGVRFNSLNIGGMHFFSEKRQILSNVCADDNDIKFLYRIYQKGIELESRVLPGDERLNIIPLIEKEYLALPEVKK
ncbi:MAG: PTS sugar transporter subunit IIB [Endomicrobium sp.]|nr:PTS sugar transporter subunit IIB [Endomicrobium sp.]